MAAISCSEDSISPVSAATRQLAQFLVESQWHGIPQAVRHEAKRTIINFVGTALGGCGDVAIELAMRALGPFFDHYADIGIMAIMPTSGLCRVGLIFPGLRSRRGAVVRHNTRSLTDDRFRPKAIPRKQGRRSSAPMLTPSSRRQTE